MKNRKKPLKQYKKAESNLDNIPSSSLRRQYYKKKREQKRLTGNIFKLHAVVRILIIFFLLWLVSRLMICRYWFLPQDTFTKYPNNHLNIIGNKITPTNQIINSLKSTKIKKAPIYLISTAPYEKQLEKLSPVKKAFVRRYWLPARFEVTIEEEIPVLTIAPNPMAPEIAAITADGSVISKEYLPIKTSHYKTYKILTYDDYKSWSKKEILSLKTLTQRIEDFSEEELIYLDIRNKKDVYAQLATTKIRIGELNSTLKARIERLSSIMPQIENLKRQTDYVDIRWENTTYLKKKSKNRPAPKSIAQTQKQPKETKQTVSKNQDNTTQKPIENKKTENIKNTTNSTPKELKPKETSQQKQEQ